MGKKFKMQEPIKAPIKQEPVVYIGKNLPGLPTNTVFSGELPPHVAELAKSVEVSGLIVPVSQLQEARRKIHVKGNILNTFYNQQLKEG